MSQEQNKTQDDTVKLNKELMKAWPKITDNDLMLYKGANGRDSFLSVVTEKQGIDRATAEKQLKEIEASCGCSMSSKAA
jgi:hypothetical protein